MSCSDPILEFMQINYLLGIPFFSQRSTTDNIPFAGPKWNVIFVYCVHPIIQTPGNVENSINYLKEVKN